eukprot:m.269785 g.269785  ORF g.269785 m.269785 type:complete len:223 (-) comp86307_c0_seq1:60-728(-)
MRATVSEDGKWVAVPSYAMVTVSQLVGGDKEVVVKHTRLDGGWVQKVEFVETAQIAGIENFDTPVVICTGVKGCSVQYSLKDKRYTTINSASALERDGCSSSESDDWKERMNQLIQQRDCKQFNFEWLQRECLPQVARKARTTGTNEEYLQLLNVIEVERTQLEVLEGQIEYKRQSIQELHPKEEGTKNGKSSQQSVVTDSIRSTFARINMGGVFQSMKRLV